MTHARNRNLERKALSYRKQQIIDLLIKGHNQASIARELKVSESVISRTLKGLKNEAREKQAQFIEEEIPMRHKIALDRLQSLIAQLYTKTLDHENISLIASLTMQEIQLLGDPNQIQDALRAVARIKKASKDKLVSHNGE